MLSDESSSDSETGRFKCQTNKDNGTNSHRREDNSRSSAKNRTADDRYSREFGRRRDERDRFERRSRERNRLGRYSPVRRRHSRERSRDRRNDSEKYRSRRGSKDHSRHRDHSASRDRRRKSRSGSNKSPLQGRNVKDEIKHVSVNQGKSSSERNEKKRHESPESPGHLTKRSIIHKPSPDQINRRKSDSPIVVEEDNCSNEEDVQPGSYYSMIPAVVKQKSEESSEIDSSDDEKLRAKLLNLEKELHKSKKKKHKKKHKKKNSKTDKEIVDSQTSVEVTSTTDIQEVTEQNTQSTEVSSTQKNIQKDSSEEGEILSEDDIDIDPNDLRHKLKRSKTESQEQLPPKLDACGPALPPHLQKRFRKSSSPSDKVEVSVTEKIRNIGPSIPCDMRKVLAERSPEIIKDESSDEDPGIGPLPSGAENKWSTAHQRLEERAYELKIKQLDGHTLEAKDGKSREQWMLELPEGKAKFLGLEARGFRAKEAPDMSDRSSWTDTPEEKARKAAGIAKEEDASEALQREAKERHISTRDKEQEQAVRKHKKKHKRDESLLEIHQKKLKKKKKKEEEEKKERRPFSRDVDLQVNRFDEAQKKSIIKKAQELDSRFSRGDAKYL